jgi:hypothetical protein
LLFLLPAGKESQCPSCPVHFQTAECQNILSSEVQKKVGERNAYGEFLQWEGSQLGAVCHFSNRFGAQFFPFRDLILVNDDFRK